jgi:putative FmdB family regulatory protein
MPIYEYSCRSCKNQFELLIRGPRTPVCPECNTEDVERLLSMPRVSSESTRGIIKRETQKRDKAQAIEQRKYELSHDD